MKYVEFSCISRNGYVVNFDTQRRKKYGKEIEDKIQKLIDENTSIRGISSIVGIPASSVNNIVVREAMRQPSDRSKPSLNYLERSECRYQYDMSDSQFDYATGRYKHLSIRRNGKVYLHYKYFSDYFYGGKGYSDNYKNFKWFQNKDT